MLQWLLKSHPDSVFNTVLCTQYTLQVFETFSTVLKMGLRKLPLACQLFIHFSCLKTGLANFEIAKFAPARLYEPGISVHILCLKLPWEKFHGTGTIFCFFRDRLQRGRPGWATTRAVTAIGRWGRLPLPMRLRDRHARPGPHLLWRPRLEQSTTYLHR
jgi:hypothetical protein